MIIGKTVILSLLILAVLVIRAVFQKKISPVIVYALWLLVAVRVFWPGMIVTSPFSIMNTSLWQNVGNVISKEESRQSKEYKMQQYQEYLEKLKRRSAELEQGAAEMEQRPETGQQQRIEQSFSGSEAYEIFKHKSGENLTFFEKMRFFAVRIWSAGMIILTVVFIRRNLILYGYLKKTRKKFQEVYVGKRKITVFLSGNELPSPCLFGVFPAIYIPERCICAGENAGNGFCELTAEGKERLSFILEHELTHYRHGDFIWSLVRILCLIYVWYNPLVWLAAGLSARDSELACDRGCVKRLGKEKRIAYGEALLAMIISVREGGALLCHATMMTSDGKFMKKRIEKIVENRENSMIAAAAVMILSFFLILTLFCAGTVFMGAADEGSRTANTAF